MTLKDVIFLCVIVVGGILFLYGSNYYVWQVGGSGSPRIVGWTGVSLIIGGFVGEVVLKVYERTRNAG